MELENQETLKTTLVGQALLFGLLGKILYAEPDRSWLDTLIRDDVFAEAPFGQDQPETKKGLELLGDWDDQISEQEFEKIKRDHFYLFLGVGKPLAPVWESVYFSESRLLFQEQTLEVRKWYARYGLEVERVGHEPDDHIGLELSFVAHLATLAALALEKNNQAEAEELLQAQRDFLSHHLLRWAMDWAELVQKHASTNFYRGLAHMTLGGLQAAAEVLNVAVPAAA